MVLDVHGITMTDDEVETNDLMAQHIARQAIIYVRNMPSKVQVGSVIELAQYMERHPRLEMSLPATIMSLLATVGVAMEILEEGPDRLRLLEVEVKQRMEERGEL